MAIDTATDQQFTADLIARIEAWADDQPTWGTDALVEIIRRQQQQIARVTRAVELLADAAVKDEAVGRILRGEES